MPQMLRARAARVARAHPRRRCRNGLPPHQIEGLEHRTLLASVPAGFTDAHVAGGLNSPTAMAVAPDGRIFVAQQHGQIRVIKNGQLLSTPFASVTVNSQNERGLGGIVLDPQFATNGYVYVYYTATSPILHNRVARFTASGDVAVGGSHTTILDLPDLIGAINHMGGAMHFGADGKLYVAVGNHDLIEADPQQSINNVYGKFLRINKDGSIPTDNPFYNQTSGINRAIYGYGLRNPFTFAIQRTTGRIFINDVGQNTWEEVNEGRAGANYGWPLSEGPTSNSNFDSPFYSYRTSEGCAITGGAFYNPPTNQFPSSYVGKYFFADLCGGWIRTLDTGTRQATTFATGANQPVDIDVHGDGTMYYLQRGDGSVRRITSSVVAPTITNHPNSLTVNDGQSATFNVSASGGGTLSYQWQRRNSGSSTFNNISGANSTSYTINSVSSTDNGAAFRAVVTNSAGSATSNAATLTVETNLAPTATITAPAAGTTFAHGQSFNYSGTGTDPEDGNLPPSAFTWQVDYYTNGVQRPFIPATSGQTSGSFTIPTTSPYTGTDVFYRIVLTVRDSGGRTHTANRDLVPRVSTVTLATSAPGLQLRLDGQPVGAPHSFQGVVGLTRSVEAPSPQSAGGSSWEFVSWSDGGSQTHNISTPESSATYTATYRALPVAFLSDLNPTFASNAHGPYERDRSNGEQGANDGGPIRLNGVTYPKGLGVHAHAELRYNLGGNYARFISDIGIDDEVGASGSVVFEVWADGTRIFNSPTMTGASQTQRVDVSVAGKNEIRLIVTDAGNGNGYDHADWADAKLLRPALSVTQSSFLFETAPHRLTFRFSANVQSSLTVSDLVLRNLTNNTTVPPGSINLAYDTTTNTATFAFPGYAGGVVPDGRYRATIAAGAVTDPNGQPMGADHSYDFHHLRGDANRDARVNLSDFNILTLNYGQSNRTFSQGDFNYDAVVNLQDFNALANRFGYDLPPA